MAFSSSSAWARFAASSFSASKARSAWLVAGASAALATADHRAAEAAWDAKERESDDPRAREAWAYRAKAKPMVDAVSVNETPADSSEADAKQAELVRKTWAVAHPPLDGTKAGETIVRTEADVADENVEA